MKADSLASLPHSTLWEHPHPSSRVFLFDKALGIPIVNGSHLLRFGNTLFRASATSQSAGCRLPRVHLGARCGFTWGWRCWPWSWYLSRRDKNKEHTRTRARIILLRTSESFLHWPPASRVDLDLDLDLPSTSRSAHKKNTHEKSVRDATWDSSQEPRVFDRCFRNYPQVFLDPRF